MKLPDDPFILELLPEFVDTWIKDIETQYSMLVNEKNAQDLYRLAHTLKGSCYQFGINDIALMGIELMEYCKTEDWEKIKKMEEPIYKSFLEVKNYINDNLNS